MAGTFIYVISGDHGRQKIGVTDDPQKRIRALQTGSPFALSFEFVGLTNDAAYEIENEAHFLLSKHRQSGEWFEVPPEVAITAVMASARRLGLSLKPVDPDNLPPVRRSFAIETIGSDTLHYGLPRKVWWSAYAIAMAAAFVVLATTGHTLSAMIVGCIIAILEAAILKRIGFHLPAIKHAWQRLMRSAPYPTPSRSA